MLIREKFKHRHYPKGRCYVYQNWERLVNRDGLHADCRQCDADGAVLDTSEEQVIRFTHWVERDGFEKPVNIVGTVFGPGMAEVNEATLSRRLDRLGSPTFELTDEEHAEVIREILGRAE